jgi:pyruvate kinase
MLDTLGVEIRMGKCKDGKPIKLVAGQNLYIHIDKARDGDNTLISTTYKQLTETVNVGYTILLKDGACTTEVLSVEEVSIRKGRFCCSLSHVNRTKSKLS